MKNREPLPEPAKLLKRYILIIAFSWTIFVLILATWGISRIQRHNENVIRKEARIHFKWIVIFREWNASHGGVYVPVTKQTPPNPYLKIKERDITTPSGKALTLMNPAYMTRLLYEQYEGQAGITGRMTSLKPLNPDNAPDSWERSALVDFEQGVKEKMEFNEINGEPYLRFMKPLFIKETCLKCHAHQGYKVGDVRGGISIYVPVKGYLTYKSGEFKKQFKGYGLIWVLGLGGLGVTSRVLRRQIRKREKVSTALRESEESKRLILDHTGEAICGLDINGNCVFANLACLKTLGYENENELLGKNVHNTIHHTRADGTPYPAEECEVYNAFIHRKEVHVENEVFWRADGSSFPVEYWSYPIIKDGGVIGAVMNFLDITERKRAEANLRKSNRMLKMLSECNGALVRSSKEDELLKEICKIIANAGGYRFVWVGYAEHDEYKSVRQVAQYGFEENYIPTLKISWADTEMGRGPSGTAIRNGVTNIASNIQTDPRYEPWRARAMERGYNSSAAFPLLIDGQAIGALNVYSAKADDFDDKEIGLLEELAGDLAYGITSLRTREERLRLFRAIEHSAETIIITDVEGKITYVNPAFEVITGYTPEEAIGQNPRIQKSGRQDEAFYKNLWDTITGGKVWTGHFVNKKKDGSYYEEDATISPVPDSKGNIISFVAVKRDVTSESALAKARDYFSSVTAHELRTPLTKLGLVKLLLQKYSEKPIDPENLDMIKDTLDKSIADFDRIVSAGELFTDLILSKTSKIFHHHDLKLILHYCVESARRSIDDENRKVALDMDIEELGDGLTIFCDQSMAQHAIGEALSNAIKYTPDGKNVYVRGKVTEKFAVIEVKDEGQGVPVEKLDMVFEPFFSFENHNIHSTSQYKYLGGGVGVGLTLARLIVERHKGKLTLQSEGEGKGTTVRMTFPLG
ncbi:diguanylate cyclase/phosphodiesterase (GGDEF & EAL domains) with PAS/PAC sensor(s) [hydrothermal vent metagenome]|uniref:histidine kinase n=1 Tax=hydrothermal vent metagenome TaxID=652676 RepID=A0A3B1BKT8_9ZZZZ